MAMMAADDHESILARLSRLNQLLDGRGLVTEELKTLVSRDGLLDILFALYDECTKDVFTRNRYVTSFVKKCMSPYCYTLIVAKCKYI